MARHYKLTPEGRARKADPAVRAKMSAASKAAWALKNPDLAGLSPEQFRVYKALRAKGCTKEEASREARRPRRRAA